LKWVWSLGGLSVQELGRRVGIALVREETLGRAAELSYYFILALFPFLICVSSVAGLIFSSDQSVYSRVLEYSRAVMPASAYDIVRATATDLSNAAGGGKLSLALLFALWTASQGMDAVIKGLNVAYDIREFRPWWKRRLVAIALTVILLLVLLFSLASILVGDFVRQWLSTTASPVFLDPAWVLVQWLVIFLSLLVALSITYVFGPNLKHQRWRAIVPGSLVAIICWIVVSLGFRTYLQFFDSYSKTYGSLGAVIVLLLWLYLTGAAILVGGEVNAQIRHAAATAGAGEAREITENKDD
jgi:membrane protein